MGWDQRFFYYSVTICIHNMGGQEDIDGAFFSAVFIFKMDSDMLHSSISKHKMTNSHLFSISGTVRNAVLSLSLVLLRHRSFIPTATWNSHKNNYSIVSHSVRSIGRLKKTYLISLKLLV